MSVGVRCMLIRGGSSKGAYFVSDDLPVDATRRDDLLRRIMGSPDPRQIDGIGGAHPLTSKVALVQRSADDGADVDYRFLQVGVDDNVVTDRQNCGNLLAGVAPFAILRGLVDTPGDGDVAVRIRMLNTDSIATARLSVADGVPQLDAATQLDGAVSISGVPGTAAPIALEFADIAGGSTGALLPTGSVIDEVDGVACTLIDNGMPVVVMRAADLGVTGYESCADLEANEMLRSRLERIRLAAGELMNLGDVSDTTVPKLTFVAAPVDGGHLATRTFIPHRCHDAIGVLGAVSVATAAMLPESPAHQVLIAAGDLPDDGVVRLEHPTGHFDAVVGVHSDTDSNTAAPTAGIIRTARILMDGIVYPRPHLAADAS